MYFKNWVYVVLYIVYTVIQNHALVEVSKVNSDNGEVLIKILKLFNEASSDERLFNVTIKFLKSLCVCMRESLKSKDKSYNGEANLFIEHYNENFGVLEDLYNRTCLNLKNVKPNELINFNNIDVKSNIYTTTKNLVYKKILHEKGHNISEKIKATNNENKNSLDILYKVLIESKVYHNYRLRKYSILRKFEINTNSEQNSILIITLYPEININSWSVNDSRIINENEIKNTLLTNSPIDIDVIDMNFEKLSEKFTKVVSASDCVLQSIYVLLVNKWNHNKIKTFKLLRKKNTIKIYINFLIENSYKDYTKICCTNFNIDICKLTENDEVRTNLPNQIENNNSLIGQVSNELDYKKTILKIKNLFKIYDTQVHEKSYTTPYDEKIDKENSVSACSINLDISLKSIIEKNTLEDKIINISSTYGNTVPVIVTSENPNFHNSYNHTSWRKLPWITFVSSTEINPSHFRKINKLKVKTYRNQNIFGKGDIEMAMLTNTNSNGLNSITLAPNYDQRINTTYGNYTTTSPNFDDLYTLQVKFENKTEDYNKNMYRSSEGNTKSYYGTEMSDTYKEDSNIITYADAELDVTENLSENSTNPSMFKINNSTIINDPIIYKHEKGKVIDRLPEMKNDIFKFNTHDNYKSTAKSTSLTFYNETFKNLNKYEYSSTVLFPIKLGSEKSHTTLGGNGYYSHSHQQNVTQNIYKEYETESKIGVVKTTDVLNNINHYITDTLIPLVQEKVTTISKNRSKALNQVSSAYPFLLFSKDFVKLNVKKSTPPKLYLNKIPGRNSSQKLPEFDTTYGGLNKNLLQNNTKITIPELFNNMISNGYKRIGNNIKPSEFYDTLPIFRNSIYFTTAKIQTTDKNNSNDRDFNNDINNFIDFDTNKLQTPYNKPKRLLNEFIKINETATKSTSQTENTLLYTINTTSNPFTNMASFTGNTQTKSISRCLKRNPYFTTFVNDLNQITTNGKELISVFNQDNSTNHLYLPNPDLEMTTGSTQKSSNFYTTFNDSSQNVIHSFISSIKSIKAGYNTAAKNRSKYAFEIENTILLQLSSNETQPTKDETREILLRKSRNEMQLTKSPKAFKKEATTIYDFNYKGQFVKIAESRNTQNPHNKTDSKLKHIVDKEHSFNVTEKNVDKNKKHHKYLNGRQVSNKPLVLEPSPSGKTKDLLSTIHYAENNKQLHDTLFHILFLDIRENTTIRKYDKSIWSFNNPQKDQIYNLNSLQDTSTHPTAPITESLLVSHAFKERRKETTGKNMFNTASKTDSPSLIEDTISKPKLRNNVKNSRYVKQDLIENKTRLHEISITTSENYEHFITSTNSNDAKQTNRNMEINQLEPRDGNIKEYFTVLSPTESNIHTTWDMGPIALIYQLPSTNDTTTNDIIHYKIRPNVAHLRLIRRNNYTNDPALSTKFIGQKVDCKVTRCITSEFNSSAAEPSRANFEGKLNITSLRIEQRERISIENLHPIQTTTTKLYVIKPIHSNFFTKSFQKRSGTKTTDNQIKFNNDLNTVWIFPDVRKYSLSNIKATTATKDFLTKSIKTIDNIKSLMNTARSITIYNEKLKKTTEMDHIHKSLINLNTNWPNSTRLSKTTSTAFVTQKRILQQNTTTSNSSVLPKLRTTEKVLYFMAKNIGPINQENMHQKHDNLIITERYTNFPYELKRNKKKLYQKKEKNVQQINKNIKTTINYPNVMYSVHNKLMETESLTTEAESATDNMKSYLGRSLISYKRDTTVLANNKMNMITSLNTNHEKSMYLYSSAIPKWFNTLKLDKTDKIPSELKQKSLKKLFNIEKSKFNDDLKALIDAKRFFTKLSDLNHFYPTTISNTQKLEKSNKYSITQDKYTNIETATTDFKYSVNMNFETNEVSNMISKEKMKLQKHLSNKILSSKYITSQIDKPITLKNKNNRPVLTSNITKDNHGNRFLSLHTIKHPAATREIDNNITLNNVHLQRPTIQTIGFNKSRYTHMSTALNNTTGYNINKFNNTMTESFLYYTDMTTLSDIYSTTIARLNDNKTSKHIGKSVQFVKAIKTWHEKNINDKLIKPIMNIKKFQRNKENHMNIKEKNKQKQLSTEIRSDEYITSQIDKPITPVITDSRIIRKSNITTDKHEKSYIILYTTKFPTAKKEIENNITLNKAYLQRPISQMIGYNKSVNTNITSTLNNTAGYNKLKFDKTIPESFLYYTDMTTISDFYPTNVDSMDRIYDSNSSKHIGKAVQFVKTIRLEEVLSDKFSTPIITNNLSEPKKKKHIKIFNNNVNMIRKANSNEQSNVHLNTVSSGLNDLISSTIIKDVENNYDFENNTLVYLDSKHFAQNGQNNIKHEAFNLSTNISNLLSNKINENMTTHLKYLPSKINNQNHKNENKTKVTISFLNMKKPVRIINNPNSKTKSQSNIWQKQKHNHNNTHTEPVINRTLKSETNSKWKMNGDNITNHLYSFSPPFSFLNKITLYNNKSLNKSVKEFSFTPTINYLNSVPSDTMDNVLHITQNPLLNILNQKNYSKNTNVTKYPITSEISNKIKFHNDSRFKTFKAVHRENIYESKLSTNGISNKNKFNTRKEVSIPSVITPYKSTAIKEEVLLKNKKVIEEYSPITKSRTFSFGESKFSEHANGQLASKANSREIDHSPRLSSNNSSTAKESIYTVISNPSRNLFLVYPEIKSQILENTITQLNTLDINTDFTTGIPFKNLIKNNGQSNRGNQTEVTLSPNKILKSTTAHGKQRESPFIFQNKTQKRITEKSSTMPQSMLIEITNVKTKDIPSHLFKLDAKVHSKSGNNFSKILHTDATTNIKNIIKLPLSSILLDSTLSYNDLPVFISSRQNSYGTTSLYIETEAINNSSATQTITNEKYSYKNRNRPKFSLVTTKMWNNQHVTHTTVNTNMTKSFDERSTDKSYTHTMSKNDFTSKILKNTLLPFNLQWKPINDRVVLYNNSNNTIGLEVQHPFKTETLIKNSTLDYNEFQHHSELQSIDLPTIETYISGVIKNTSSELLKNKNDTSSYAETRPINNFSVTQKITNKKSSPKYLSRFSLVTTKGWSKPYASRASNNITIRKSFENRSTDKNYTPTMSSYDFPTKIYIKDNKYTLLPLTFKGKPKINLILLNKNSNKTLDPQDKHEFNTKKTVNKSIDDTKIQLYSKLESINHFKTETYTSNVVRHTLFQSLVNKKRKLKFIFKNTTESTINTNFKNLLKTISSQYNSTKKNARINENYTKNNQLQLLYDTTSENSTKQNFNPHVIMDKPLLSVPTNLSIQKITYDNLRISSKSKKSPKLKKTINAVTKMNTPKMYVNTEKSSNTKYVKTPKKLLIHVEPRNSLTINRPLSNSVINSVAMTNKKNMLKMTTDFKIYAYSIEIKNANVIKDSKDITWSHTLPPNYLKVAHISHSHNSKTTNLDSNNYKVNTTFIHKNNTETKNIHKTTIFSKRTDKYYHMNQYYTTEPYNLKHTSDVVKTKLHKTYIHNEKIINNDFKLTLVKDTKVNKTINNKSLLIPNYKRLNGQMKGNLSKFIKPHVLQIQATSEKLRETQHTINPQLTTVKKIKPIKYNTYMPTIDELDISIDQLSNTLRAKKKGSIVQKINVHKNLQKYKSIYYHATHANVTIITRKPHQLMSSTPSIKKNKLEQQMYKNFRKSGTNSETLLDPFGKTNLYPIKMIPPQTQRRIMKRIRIANKNQDVMSMNSHNFFSQNGFATHKNIFKDIPILHRQALHIDYHITPEPRRRLPESKEMKKNNPNKEYFRPKPLLVNDDFYKEDFQGHHKSGFTWRDKVNFVREAIIPPVTEKEEKDYVIEKPEHSQPLPTLNKPKFLRDRIDSIRSYLNMVDMMPPTRKPVNNYFMKSVSSDSEVLQSQESAKYYLMRDGWIDHPITSTTTATLKYKKRSRRTLFFLSPTVTEWWLDDMYLKVRLPLPINSNPGMVFPKRSFAKMDEVADLGALFVDDLLDYKEMLDRGELPLERATSREKGQPLCMEQFYRLLGVCRIPEVGRDRLELPKMPGESTECEELIVVACRNYFYPIPVKAADRGRLTPGEIQAQLLHAMVDAAGAPPAPRIGLLTTMNRDHWARAREHLIKDEMNRMNMELISRALCILCLDEGGGDRADADADTNAMLRAMHGAGTQHHSANRWFDKTVQLIISSDGTVGMCYEHSAAEGVAVIRLAERALARAEVAARPAPPPALLPAPQAMKWTLGQEVQRTIDRAAREFDRQISDLDFKVYTYRGYGREFMKSCRTSPDVYIQLAMQYAYYKMYGYLVSTYESASLRRFRNGRVDNIRSAHGAARRWAAAMCAAETPPLADDDGQKKVSFNLYGDQKKLELFDEAARKQTAIMEANILGRGIDNHLLGLREAARESTGELPPLFTDPTYKQMIEFKLSTSQVATTTDGTFMGYGAVVPDGYGCSYNPKKDCVIFCISSFSSSSVTNTEAFRLSLEEALDSMKLMFQNRKVET